MDDGAPRRVSTFGQIAASAVLIALAVGVWLGGADLARTLGIADALGLQSAEGSAAPRGRQRSAPPVILAEVVEARDDIAFEAVGDGRAIRSVTLRADASGEVASTELAPGKRFRAGEVVMTLDDGDAQLAVSLAKTRLAEAERVADRYRRLLGTGAASSSALEEAATLAEVARLELERAERDLSKRSIRAPFAGVTSLPEVEIGDWIDQGDAIATYDDRSVLLVEVDLPEALLSRVQVGHKATARTPAYRERVWNGEVVAIDSRISPTTRSAKLRVALPNEEDLLRPGASFAIRLALPGAVYPSAPELALQFSRGSLYVWRVVDGVAEKVEVSLVRRVAGAVLLDGALEPGDSVVTEGAQRVGEGRKVAVVQEESADRASPPPPADGKGQS